LVYKLVASAIFLIFAFFISDTKNKQTKPLIKQPWITIMRICYPISPLCYVFFLWKTTNLLVIDYLSLLMMVLGTAIVIAAKRKLGKNHSWVGYSSENVTQFTKTGIYKHVRHPLYLGIIIAVFGTVSVAIQNARNYPILFFVYLFGMVAIFLFMGISSKKETDFLIKKFGDDFIAYRNSVPAFFPKFQKKDDVVSNAYTKVKNIPD